MGDGNAAGGGVECLPMNAGGVAIGRTRTALPTVADYLQRVWELGRASLRPALPALAFLYFYRVGVGAYMALSDNTFPEGADTLSRVLPLAASLASFLPLLLLVYTPFLPLQDCILRGRAMSFLEAIRRVFEIAWNFTLSGLAQGVILFVPFLTFCTVPWLIASPDSPARSGAVPMLAVLFLILLAVAWPFLVGLFLMFATPAVVLDDEGPVQSLKTSSRLVRENFAGVAGRLLAFGFVAVVLYVVAAMPAGILAAVERASGAASAASAPIKIAGVIWSSAADTLLFPFWVAALMVLYRSLVPRAAEARGGVPPGPDDEPRHMTAPNAPFE